MSQSINEHDPSFPSSALNSTTDNEMPIIIFNALNKSCFVDTLRKLGVRDLKKTISLWILLIKSNTL